MSQSDSTLLEIVSLGGMGDGIAHANGQTVFVPFTCVGDQVEVSGIDPRKNPARAKLVRVVTPSPERAIPPCPHFGECGGCQLQHLSTSQYRAFKEVQFTQIIKQLGYDASCIQPIFAVNPATRRRAEFSVSAKKGEVTLGFAEAGSYRIIDLAACPVLVLEIKQALPALRGLIASLHKPKCVERVQITAADAHQLDILIQVKSRPADEDMTTLKSFSLDHLARLSIKLPDGKIQVLQQKADVTITLANHAVELPAGAFLQATAPSQQAMTDIVTHHLADCKKVVDLFSGCGTYSLPLAVDGKIVHAYEGDQDMVAALYNASRQLENGQLNGSVRDLFTTPLSAQELAPYDGAVINPPRNGALPQARTLAESAVKKLVMVSCNPATFARDAATLKQGGYELISATPIDQFLWSYHLELVACFAKA